MEKKLKQIFLFALLSLIVISPRAYALENDTGPVEEKLELSSDLVLDEKEIVEDLEVYDGPRNPNFNRQESLSSGSSNKGLMVDPFSPDTEVKEEFSRQFSNFLPRKFDLRSQNRTTPVKDQGPNGSCWAFASYGSAESVLLPREFTDFSEKNMRNTHGYDWRPDQGGTHQVAAAYLARWSGPILERDEPYSPYDFRSPSGLRPVKELDEALYIPDTANGNNQAHLKRALMNYGASYTTVGANEYYTNKYIGSHYMPPNAGGYADHAVTIIGWDDDYPASNFKFRPPANGAWIVKNSWGSYWGNLNGYYYVSYYDKFIGRSNCVFSLKNKDRNKEIWQYDYLGMTSTIGNGRTAWFSNIFGPVQRDSEITEIGVFVPSAGMSYEVYVNTGFGSGSGFNNRKKVASGNFTYAGYQTVKFPGQRIARGSYFAPIVKFTSNGNYYPIPIEQPIRGYSSRASAQANQSFISYDGNYWMDLTSQRYNSNVSLKAFTRPVGSSPAPDVDPRPNPDPRPDPEPRPDPRPSLIKIESINFVTKTLELVPGDERTLTPSVLPANATNKRLNFTVSDPSVASVRDGRLKALNPGKARIEAISTDGSNKRAGFDLIVKDLNQGPKISYISLTPNNNSIGIGESYQLKATINPANAYNKDLVYESENPAIASVDKSGRVKGLKVGKTTIIAKAQDGSGKSQRAYVSVSQKSDPRQIKINSSINESGRRKLEVNAKDTLGRNLRYVRLRIEVKTPSGRLISKNLYTNYYGNASYDLSSSNFKEPGLYTVKIDASGTGYTGAKDELSFTVEDTRPSFDTNLSLSNDKIYNDGQISIDIACKNGAYAVSYADVDLTIELANGKVHKNTGRTNYYGKLTYTYKPEYEDGGVYKVKVKANKNGYKDSLAETSFTVEEKPSPYKLNLKLNKDKDSYKIGDRAVVDIGIENGLGQKMARQAVKVRVTGPNNFSYALTKYTNYYGQTQVFITPTNNMEPGAYKLIAEVDVNGYKGDIKEVDLNFLSEDEEENLPVEEKIFQKLETDEAEDLIEKNKDSDDFVILDVRTKAEYDESHIEGAINDDFYADGHKDFLKGLDKSKSYLVYCRTQNRSYKSAKIMEELGFGKIYWMNGGMTQWLKEGRPSIFPDFDKALDLDLKLDKVSYEPGSDISLDLISKDLDQNRVGEVKLGLMLYRNGKLISKEEAASDTNGESVFTLTAPEEAGHYDIKVLGKKQSYKSFEGYTSFKVGEEKSRLPYDQAGEKGYFGHLSQNDYEYKVLKENYGKNILQYKVKDRYMEDKKLYDLIDPNKKTVLVFGYPGCGPCVDMWEDMNKMDHKDYNFILVVTSVEDDGQKTVDFVDDVVREKGLSNLKDRIYYDASDKVWSSRLGLITTPNTLVLDEGGSLVNIGGKLGREDLLKIVAYDLGLDKEEDQGPKASLSLDLDKEKIGLGETVRMTARAKDPDSKDIYRARIRYRIEFPNGEFETGVYDRIANSLGTTVLSFTSDESSPDGEYTITAELIGSGYECPIAKKTFVVEKQKPTGVLLDLSTDKESYTPGEIIKMTLKAKTEDGRPQAYQPLRFSLTFPDGKTYNYDRQTDRYGQALLTYTTVAQSPQGSYTIKARMQSGEEAEVGFSLGASDKDPYEPNDPYKPDEPQGFLSFDERDKRGDFSHIRSNDLYSKLRSVYGSDLSSYSLSSMSGSSIRIGQIMDGSRPTVIALGYPSCGGCQSSWRQIGPMNKSSFNFIEAMTTNNPSEISTTLSRLGLGYMENDFYYNGRNLFNLINSNYVPVLLYLDKEGKLVNVSYFNSTSEMLSIVRSI